MVSPVHAVSATPVTHAQEYHRRKRRRLSSEQNDSQIKVHIDEAVHNPSNSQTEEAKDALSVPSHPLGIKPLGNSWDAKINTKSFSGAFSKLPDELLLELLEFLPPQDLISLGSTCRSLYAFTRSEELWKNIFVELFLSSDFKWRRTWRNTFLNIPLQNLSLVQCPDIYSDNLYRPWQCANLPLETYVSSIPARNAITRLPALTAEEYGAGWAGKPFILTEPVKQWPAYKDWNLEYLLSKYGETQFRAEAVDWKFKTYMEYMRDSTEESPLYLFDCQFAQKMGITAGSLRHTTLGSQEQYDDRHAESTMPAYSPPDAFAPDLFEVLGTHRPDHAWLIIGPTRSGSTFHSDPNGTSAWNAVLRGSKYWIMFPPPTKSNAGIPGVHLSPDLSHVTSPLSLSEYLLTFHAAARRTPGCIEGVCKEGEILHVPAGWYHMVVNLEEGVALTQNFVSEAGLVGCLQFLRDRREQVSGFNWEKPQIDNRSACDEHEESVFAEGSEYELFVAKLKSKYPELLERAMIELGRRDKLAAISPTGDWKASRGKWEEVAKGFPSEQAMGKAQKSQEFSFGFGSEGDDSE